MHGAKASESLSNLEGFSDGGRVSNPQSKRRAKRIGDPTMPDRSSPNIRVPSRTRTSAPGTEFLLPEQTFRWILRKSVQGLRLPLLGAILPPPAGGGGEEDDPDGLPEAGTPHPWPAPKGDTRVVFLDTEGNETAAARAVGVDVESTGPDGELVRMRFTRLAHRETEAYAA
jgi:hypothetical protein